MTKTYKCSPAKKGDLLTLKNIKYMKDLKQYNLEPKPAFNPYMLGSASICHQSNHTKSPPIRDIPRTSSNNPSRLQQNQQCFPIVNSSAAMKNQNKNEFNITIHELYKQPTNQTAKITLPPGAKLQPMKQGKHAIKK